MNFLWVALGGAVGASARFGVNEAAARLVPSAFPFATIFVNVSGCFLMGVIAGLAQNKLHLSDAARLFLTTGILGGFTTFSAFALDVATLTADRGQLSAAVYVTGSVLLSIAAVFVGLALARMFS